MYQALLWYRGAKTRVMVSESKWRFTWVDTLLTVLTFGIWGLVKLNDRYYQPKPEPEEISGSGEIREDRKESLEPHKRSSKKKTESFNPKKLLAKVASFSHEYFLKLRGHRVVYKSLTLIFVVLTASILGWLGFNALLMLSDASCDISCGTDVSGGGYFFGSPLTPDVDCTTDCNTSCTSGFSFGGYQSAPDCDTYCDTSCESSGIDASDIDVDVNCGASCGLYPPRLNARTIETLFSPRYLRILLYRSFGLQL